MNKQQKFLIYLFIHLKTINYYIIEISIINIVIQVFN